MHIASLALKHLRRTLLSCILMVRKFSKNICFLLPLFPTALIAIRGKKSLGY